VGNYDPRLAFRTYAAEDRDWHIDAGMAEISLQYTLEDAAFLAPKIFPVVPVGKQHDRYYIFDRQDWFRIPETRRARGTRPNEVEFAVSSGGYFADNYMLTGKIPFEDLDNADDALEIEASTAKHVTQLLMLDYENRVAGLCTTAANVGSGNALSGTGRWDDRTGSDPVSDVSTGKSWISLQIGRPPKDLTMVVGQQVHEALVMHPDILDRIKYVQRATNATAEAALADIFGVRQYLVGGAISNSADEAQPATMAFIWGKNVVLMYTPTAPGRNVPSAGYSFRWRPQGFTDFVVETKDDDDRKLRMKRVGYFQDEKITAPEAIYLLTTVVN